jgi:VWFA-related protein
MKVSWAAVLSVVLLAPLLATAQTPPQDADQTTTLRAKTSLVLVPALVTTKSGEPVFTLTADDFTLTDDGIPQTLRLEEDADRQPLALVLLVQSGGDGAKHLRDYRGLETMLEAMVGGVEHNVAVVDFDSEPELLLPFTTQFENVDDALLHLEGGDDGAVLLDALKFSVDLLRTQPPKYRRAILMLSETRDRGSKASIADTVRAVSDTNTAIYSFAFSSTRGDVKRSAGALPAGLGGNDEPGPAGGCMSRKPDADGNPPKKSVAEQGFDCLSLLAPPLALAKMAFTAAQDGLRRNLPETVAHLTGGEYFGFKDAKGLEKGLQTLTNHVPNRYMLSFTPQHAQSGLHALTLSLKDRPGLDVTARTSYWDENAPLK